jgi:peptidyl-prolyl cis-trans isomerase SurA
VTLADVQAVVSMRQRELQARHKGKEMEEQLKKLYEDGLDVVIGRYLIMDSYRAQEGKIPEWAVDQEVEEVIRENFHGERSALMSALSKDHLTFETWRDELRNHIIVSSMRTMNVGQNVRILPSRVSAHYEENKSQYEKPAQTRLRVIVLNKEESGKDAAPKRRQAEDIRQRLMKGADFAAVAKEVSQGTKAAEGGDWGWVSVEDLRTELRKAISGLRPGQISEVVDTPEEIYIVKVEEQRERGAVSLKEVQSEIEQELRKEETERLYKAWVERLKRNAYVKIIGWKGAPE